MTAKGRQATETITLRLRPDVKRLLRDAARRDRRSMANLVEVLIVEHCRGERDDGNRPRRAGAG
jgi:hypothetical protein